VIHIMEAHCILSRSQMFRGERKYDARADRNSRIREKSLYDSMLRPDTTNLKFSMFRRINEALSHKAKAVQGMQIPSVRT
jgi:hypothetical protein